MQQARDNLGRFVGIDPEIKAIGTGLRMLKF